VVATISPLTTFGEKAEAVHYSKRLAKWQIHVRGTAIPSSWTESANIVAPTAMIP